MKFFGHHEQHGQPSVGLAAGPAVPALIAAQPGLVDFVEIPIEQLRHAPEVAALQDMLPAVLHCSSMSIAGFVPPDDAELEAIAAAAVRMRTPWIGEHLAFLAADPLSDGASEPTRLTYTVCPQLSEETIERVALNLARLKPLFPMPIILENSPQYFEVPGSTMAMTEFIARVIERCDVGLLLDLTHFLISAHNRGFDPLRAIDALPLERVVEVHLSGMSVQSGIAWDDHGAPAPDVLFELLARVLRRARPRALTFEYNWAPSVDASRLQRQIARARELLAS